MAAPISVFTGLWIDRSFDSTIYGATLTLPVREANYLVTFLAFLVTVCATFFWIIFAFVLHQVMIRGNPVDVVGLQIQIALRNAGTPIGLVWEGFKILHAWRDKQIRGLWRRIAVIALPALLISTSFLIASISVAEVASKEYGNIPVLAKEGLCGMLIYPSTRAAFAAANGKLIGDTIAARQYAKNWYGSNVSSLSAQTLYPVRSLPYTTSNSTPCPWNKRCVLGPDRAFSLQTDLLDSHSMLGINARRENRISYRKNVTCSVVSTKDFQHLVNDTDEFDTSGLPKWIEYHMGPIINGTQNATYSYFMEVMRGGVGYLMHSTYWRPGEPYGHWEPAPPFNRNDSDLSMFWLSQNGISYEKPTLDPFFFANGSFPTDFGVQGNYWVNVMACADKHQFCNPNTNVCGAWTGWTDVLSELYTLGYNPDQFAAAGRFFNPIILAGTYSSVSPLGISALLAQELVEGTLSVGLPDDQWKLEVTRWFETSLAKLQSQIIQYAQNDVDPDGLLQVQGPNQFPNDPEGFTTAMESQCGNQRIQSTRQYQSFSVLGLFIAVGITFVLGVIAGSLETLVGMIRNGKISDRDTALQADDSRHLLRMVLQNEATDHDVDQGWQNSSWGVPFCDGDTLVARPLMGTNRLANYRSDPSMLKRY